MANVKDLLVNGSARVIGTIYGNATSANNSDKLDGKHLSEIAAAKSTTLAWGTSSTIATIGGNNITLTMPANPNTDTHYTTGITAGATGTTSNSATTNGNTFIKIKDNSTHRGQIKIVGSGATSVSSDANGIITINSTDNNTVYSHPAGSAASKSSGLYKFSTDSTSHISGVTAVTKADITALGIPGQDTTYGSMSIDEGTTGTATANRVLTAANLKSIINAHAPTKTGGGASGSWGISVTGSSASCTGNAASASKVNNKLTVGSKTFDGSAAVTLAASDLGLASAMLFLGTTTTAITDGATTNPVTIGGSNKTVTAGNVVLYGSKEFVWTGSAWEELGNEGSYKIVQAAVGDPNASGTSNTFIDTISQDANGKITATKKTVAVTNNAPTLSWGTTSTIGTVAGTNLQVTMPANPNIDTKVTQNAITASDYTNWRPLIWGASNSSTEGFTPSTVTDGVYTAQTLSCQPSSGTIRATTFKGNLSGNAATATKLTTVRTIWGQSFDGTANITGNLSNVGDNIRLLSGLDRFQFLTSTYGAAWGSFKGLYLSDSYTNDTTYRLYVNGSSYCSGGIVSQHGHNFLVASNEFNYIPDNFNNTIYINYQSWNRNSTSTVQSYVFCNGHGGGAPGYFSQVYGAVWNDYAEFRSSPIKEPGRCVYELGDDTLALTTRRLQKGCEIISDTFGFAIGETEECKTPIAVTGRVLAYPYESREEFKKHIGDCVCSGPDGTVSIMTPEEEKEYPSCIIGTISAVPSYEKWGSGEVDVSGRVWIRIR